VKVKGQISTRKHYKFRELRYKHGVYQIRNIINNYLYIGSTVCFFDRCYGHFKDLSYGHHQQKLQNAYNKYGEENFEFEILEIVEDKESLREREQYYLDTLLSAQEFIRKEDKRFEEVGYNIDPIATGSIYVTHSDETRKRMSKVVRTEEQKENLRQINLEKVKNLSEEESIKRVEKSKQTKIRNGTYRKDPRTPEGIQRNRDAQKGEGNSMSGRTGITSPKAKPVLQLDIITEKIINIYGSVSEVPKSFQIPKECRSKKIDTDRIGVYCREGKPLYGFKWKFITKEEYFKLVKNED